MPRWRWSWARHKCLHLVFPGLLFFLSVGFALFWIIPGSKLLHAPGGAAPRLGIEVVPPEPLGRSPGVASAKDDESGLQSSDGRPEQVANRQVPATSR